MATDNNNESMVAKPEALLLFHILNVLEWKNHLRASPWDETAEAEFLLADVNLSIQRKYSMQVRIVGGLKLL